MNNKVRKRSPNWLPSEKKLLLDIVERHFHVVENKKTDGVTVKAKLAEWQKISIEYNSQTSHYHRDSENLKSQWENMKKAAKKEASNNRMRMIQTGGGPPDTKREDPNYSRIISLIKTSAVGLFNPFDNDSVAPFEDDQENSICVLGSDSEVLAGSCNKDLSKTSDIDQPQILTNYMPQPVHPGIEDVPITVSYSDTRDCEESTAKDWGDYTPQLLRTPVTEQLKSNSKKGVSRRRPCYTTSSLERLHLQKIEALKSQAAFANEEADLKRAVANLEIQIKTEILKQEKIKTKLLLMELRKKKKELSEN